MQHLWAPWRMAYVTNATKQDGCVFCTKTEAADEESLILHRGKLIFVMMNAYPYNCGHLLVAPYRHLADPLEMLAEEGQELLHGVRLCMLALTRAMRPEGFNIGLNIGAVSGAGIADHMHVHVVPRWGGDTNFLTVAAQTRVVPESLLDTFHRLQQVWLEDACAG